MTRARRGGRSPVNGVHLAGSRPVPISSNRSKARASTDALKGPEARAVDRLTLAEWGRVPNLLKDARGALLAVKTNKGNVARLLVTPELRKGDDGKAVPVFVLERFDTFDAADLSARLAGGRAMMLFPGFQVDLDTGQVVPEGQGGDLVYSGERGACAGLDSAGATLFVLTRAPAPDPSKPPQPTPGRAVVPTDFAGRYRLFANGQWSGTSDLQVRTRAKCRASSGRTRTGRRIRSGARSRPTCRTR